jgi:hypothetical protein
MPTYLVSITSVPTDGHVEVEMSAILISLLYQQQLI